DRRKFTYSLVSNGIVMAFVFWFLISTRISFKAARELIFTPRAGLILAIAVAAVVLLWWVLRNRISVLSHKILKSPLRTGLFQNYERTRFLKERIHQRRLRRSPIRLVMTAAELYTG